MRSSRCIRIGVLMLGFSLLPVAPAAGRGARPSAQDAAAPAQLPAAPSFNLPPAPVTMPGGRISALGEPVFNIHGFVFEGNTVISTADLQRIASPFIGQAVTVADLEELRQRLTRYYVDAGYVNSGVVAAANPLRAGYFHYRIVEGYLQIVQLQGQERLREGYISQRLLRWAGQPLNLTALQEGFQLLLSDPLIARLNGRLLAGEHPGASVLDLEVTRAQPYQLSLYTDNHRPPSVGAESVGIDSWVRNLTTLGDLFNLSVNTSRGGNHYFGQWTLPINDYGTQLYFLVDEDSTLVIEEPLASVAITSRLHGREIGMIQSLIERLRWHFNLGLSLATRTNETYLLNVPFSFVNGLDDGRSRVTVMRFFQESIHRWERQALAVRSTFSWGLSALNATEQDHSIGPDSRYTAWTGQAHYSQRLLDNGTQWVTRGSLQLSQDSLLPQEQFALGGAGSVRGYRENQFVRDQGYSVSLELQYPLLGSDTHGAANLFLVPFIDYGATWNRGESKQALHALGLGLTGKYHQAQGELYWAYPLIARPADQDGNLQDAGIHFQFRLDIF